MRERICNHCGAPAAFSVALILSSLGCSPRLQKTSAGLRLCDACIQASMAGPLVSVPFTGKEALKETYTQLANGFKERTDPRFEEEELSRMSASSVKGGPKPPCDTKFKLVDRETTRNKAR